MSFVGTQSSIHPSIWKNFFWICLDSCDSQIFPIAKQDNSRTKRHRAKQPASLWNSACRHRMTTLELFYSRWTPKVLVAGSSNRIGVSSILRIWLKSYPQHWRDLRTNRWNWMTLSSMSAGSRWARVVFALMDMEWWCFQFVYQPSDALNLGSVLSSFALSWSIMLLTDRPATTIKRKCQFLDQIQWA